MPAPLDLPLALELLTTQGRLTPADDWGPKAQSGAPYADFAAGWRGSSAVPTLAELNNAWTAYLAAHPEFRTSPRLPRDIIVQLLALSAAQKSAILTDLTSGNPPKWMLSASPVVWSQAPALRNAAGALQIEAALVAVCYYILEPGHGNYLVNPAFSPAINIPAYG